MPSWTTLARVRILAAAAYLGAFALTLTLSGCIYVMLPGLGRSPVTNGPDFHKAVYRITGTDILIRNDDSQPWRQVHITLSTDLGYFRQTTGDMEPGETRDLKLAKFTDEELKSFGPGNRLQSVWIQARYPSGKPVNELAFPAATFGYPLPVAPTGPASPSS
jgi:hypothetical protein